MPSTGVLPWLWVGLSPMQRFYLCAPAVPVPLEARMHLHFQMSPLKIPDFKFFSQPQAQAEYFQWTGGRSSFHNRGWAPVLTRHKTARDTLGGSPALNALGIWPSWSWRCWMRPKSGTGDQSMPADPGECLGNLALGLCNLRHKHRSFRASFAVSASIFPSCRQWS